MIHIALVDDDHKIIEQLKRYIGRYYDNNTENYKITVFLDGMDLLTNYRPVYDLIFMDIHMSKLDGLRTARRLREADENVLLVFITNLAKYAVRGYEVNALDFMVKPLKYEHFSMNMKKAEGILKKYTGSNIVININGEFHVLSTTDIYYVEVNDHWLIYCLRDRSYKVRGSMKKLQEQIKTDDFQMCNRCYLVNMKHVKSIKGDMVTVGEYQLKISRARKKEFTAALTDYFGGNY